MTGNKGKIVGTVALTVLMAVSVSGCKFNVSFVNNYPDADKYVSGDTTYDATKVSTIDISWISGDITVVETDGDTLNVTENSSSLTDAQKVHTYLDGDTLKVKFCESGYIKSIDSKYKKVVVEIPADCNLKVDTVSANVNLGDLTASDISVNSVSGSVIGNSVETKKVDYDSTSGALKISNLKCDEVEMDTVSGNFTSDAVVLEKFDFDSTSGSVNISDFTFDSFEMDTVSGNAVLDVADDFGVTVDKDSVSGDFKSNLDFTKDGKKFVFGDGSATVSFDSTSGDLTLK